MSESRFKIDNEMWRKGYNRGRDDARREPTYGPRKFYLLLADAVRDRKGTDFCEGYETGYEEARY